MKSAFERYYSGFVKAPLFWAAALFCLGIALSSALHPDLFWQALVIAGLVGAAVLVLALFKKSGLAQTLASVLFCLSLAAMGALYYRLWLPAPDDKLVEALRRAGPLRLELKVIRPSEEREKYSRVLCELTALGLGPGAVAGRGRVWLSYSDEETFFPGDHLVAWARVRGIKGYRNPFVPDPSLRLKRGGIYFSAAQLKEIPIFRLGRSNHFLMPGLYRFRQKVKDELDRSGSGSSYLLSAMLLGEKGAVPAPVWKNFQVTNTAHILVISGYNLSLIGLFFFVLTLGFFRAQPWLLKRYDPYPIAALLSAIPTTSYAVLTGLEVPTFRALIMVLLLLAAIALRKTRDLFNALGLAAMVILLINPSSLFDASFQLSFLSAFALIAYGPSVWRLCGGQWFEEETKLILEEKGVVIPKLRYLSVKALKYFYGLFLATILIQLFLSPLSAYYFSQLSFSGPFCNLLLVPVCGFWVYPIGIMGLWAAGFWPGLAGLLFNLAGLGAWLMEKTAAFFAGLPHSVLMVRTPTPFEMFGWFALLLGLFEMLRLFSRPVLPGFQKKKIFSYALLWPMLLMVSGAGFALKGYSEVAQSRLGPEGARVSVLDVGLGQSLLVELQGKKGEKGRKRILIDGGGKIGSINLGQALVSRFLLAKGIRELDMVVLTHPETDHSAGLEYILSEFRVKEFWLPQRSNQIARTLLDIAERKKIKIRWISREQPPLLIGGAKLEFLNPAAEIKKNTSLNDSSAVIKMEYENTSVLFPGDVSSRVEKQLVEIYGERLKSRVLVAGHHGSKSSSSAEFLKAVSPGLVLISGAQSSHLKLPSEETLARIKKSGAAVLRTDRDGEIEVSLNKNSVSAKTYVESGEH